jgi:hypothetical protein
VDVVELLELYTSIRDVSGKILNISYLVEVA